MRTMMLTAAVVLVASMATAETWTWQGYSSEWSVATNWLGSAGQTGVPAAGDTAIVPSKYVGTAYPKQNLETAPLATIQLRKSADYSQIIFCLQPGGEGMSASFGKTLYSGLKLDGEGEITFNTTTSGDFKLQKGVTGTGTLVKIGPGTLTDAYEVYNVEKTTKRYYSIPKTILREGRINIYANTVCSGHEFVFDGNADTRLGFGATVSQVLNLTFENGSISETETVDNTTHGMTSANDRQLTFTGTPKQNPMRFTGQLYDHAGLNWSPVAVEEGAEPYEFRFAKAVSATQGQLIVSNGVLRLTEGASMTNLSKVVVGPAGTFKVDVGAGGGFHATTLELEASTSRLHLGAGVALAFDTATLAGENLADGIYRATSGWIEGDGIVIVGAVESPSDVLTITEGSSYPLAADATYQYAGVELTAPGDFDFTAGEGAMFVLGEQGFKAAVSETARTLTFAWPLWLRGAQLWEIPAGNVFVQTGRIATLALGKVQVVGKGKLELRGDNTFANDLAISNAEVHAYSDTAFGSAAGKTEFDRASGSTLTVHGITTDEELAWPGEKPGSVTLAFFKASEDKSVVTNVFNGYVHCDYGGNQYFSIDKGVVAVFCGGVTKSAGLFGPRGEGTMVIEDKILTPARLSLPDSATLVLNVSSNNFGNNAGQIYGTSKVITKKPYAIYACNGSSVKARLTISGTLDLDGNDQSIVSINGAGTVTSEKGAVLHLVDKSMAGSSDGGCTCQVTRVTFKGGAGFSKEERFTNWLYTASASTGTVTVTKGRLVLTRAGTDKLLLTPDGAGNYARPKADVGWTNATAAVVAGGTMVLEHSKAFGTRTAFELSSNGKLHLDAGVRQRCGSLSTNGVEALPGTYGSTASDAMYKDDAYFTGSGVLKVGSLGTVILIR